MTNQEQPSQAPAGQPAAGRLPRVSPAAAWGYFICCVGIVWTIITYFQVCAGLNKIKKDANLQAWTIFVPIYCAIYLSTVIATENKIIEENGLQVAKVGDNILLSLFFPFLPWMNIFKAYNSIADAMEAKG